MKTKNSRIRLTKEVIFYDDNGYARGWELTFSDGTIIRRGNYPGWENISSSPSVTECVLQK
jgi:hypothetical protein